MTTQSWAWTFAAALGVLLFGAFTLASIQRADAQVEVWRLQGVADTQTRTITAIRKQLETATALAEDTRAAMLKQYAECLVAAPEKPVKKPEAKRVTPVFPYARSVQ